MRVVRFLTTVLVLATPLFGQTRRGELRLKVADPACLGVKSSVDLVSEASHALSVQSVLYAIVPF